MPRREGEMDPRYGNDASLVTAEDSDGLFADWLPGEHPCPSKRLDALV